MGTSSCIAEPGLFRSRPARDGAGQIHPAIAGSSIRGFSSRRTGAGDVLRLIASDAFLGDSELLLLLFGPLPFLGSGRTQALTHNRVIGPGMLGRIQNPRDGTPPGRPAVYRREPQHAVRKDYILPRSALPKGIKAFEIHAKCVSGDATPLRPVVQSLYSREQDSTG